jgi:hypothetical protein
MHQQIEGSSVHGKGEYVGQVRFGDFMDFTCPWAKDSARRTIQSIQVSSLSASMMGECA